jgi:RNA polymerase sigma factor (TIGR02999 family)
MNTSPPPEPGGDPAARTTDELFRAVYAELRRVASAHLAQERPGHTLTPTALVNEVYLRFARRPRRWNDRAHFLRTAARAMRNILLSHARGKARLKRGGGRCRVELDALNLAAPPADENLIALDDALTVLTAEDPLAAAVVEMRYFGEAGWADIAAALRIPESAVKQNWAFAKAWLFNRLRLGSGAGA